MTPQNVILINDLGGDVGAVLDLGLLCALHKLGHVKVLAMVFDSPNQYACAAANIVAQTYGVGAIPMAGREDLAAWAPAGGQTPATNSIAGNGGPADPNAQAASGGFPVGTFTWWINSLGGTAFPTSAYPIGYGYNPGGTALMRQQLAAAPNGSVVIFCNTNALMLSRLLNSAADNYAPLNGVQLVAQKVSKLIWAAGYYPNSGTIAANIGGQGGAEQNMKALGEPTENNNVLNNWPSTIIFNDTHIGDSTGVAGGIGVQVATSIEANKITHGTITAPAAGDCPLAAGLVYYNKAAGFGRQAWGQVATFALLQGLAGFSLVAGSQNIKRTPVGTADGALASTLAFGYNVFTPSATGAQPQFYTQLTEQPYSLISKINALLYANQFAPQFTLSWSPTAALVRLSS